MSELKTIVEVAHPVLTIPTAKGRLEQSLWDRAQRLAQNIESICRLDEITGSSLPIDILCVTSAAYWSDAGLAEHLGSKEHREYLNTFDTNNHSFLERSTEILAEKLAGLIDAQIIDKISQIITESAEANTQMTEAKILSDARNLDDMGVTGIVNDIKRCSANGKGILDIIKNWQRKIDYGYWQARLKDSFRFDSVQKLAEQRINSAEHFMNQLQTEASARDIEERQPASAGVS